MAAAAAAAVGVAVAGMMKPLPALQCWNCSLWAMADDGDAWRWLQNILIKNGKNYCLNQTHLSTLIFCLVADLWNAVCAQSTASVWLLFWYVTREHNVSNTNTSATTTVYAAIKCI